MAESLERFSWGVPAGGVMYAARARSARDPHRQHAGLLVPASHEVRPYDPAAGAPGRRRGEAEGPPLLIELVALDVDDGEACARFASRWGLLGLETRAVLAGGVDWPVASPTPVVEAEPHRLWRQAVAALRGALELLGLIQARDASTIAARLGRGSDRFITYSAPGFEAGYLRAPGWATEHVRRGGPVAAGEVALQAAVNRALAGGSSLRVVYSPESRRFEQRATFGSLLAFAWYQLGETFGGGGRVKRCPRRGCGRWFLETPSLKRRNQLYCRPACKVAVDAQRQRARELAAAGRSVGAISRAVGYSPTLVREWIGARRATGARVTPQRVKRRSS